MLLLGLAGVVVGSQLGDTVSASPRRVASKLSSPSMLARLVTKVAPVALAILLRSCLLHLLTAMAPASTKYFKHRSSMPPVVRITLAPVVKILLILSLVMSLSLSVIFSRTRLTTQRAS